MAPKYAFAVLGSLALLALGAPALANDYRAGELLTLDLSKAVLSPKRIGPLWCRRYPAPSPSPLA